MRPSNKVHNHRTSPPGSEFAIEVQRVSKALRGRTVFHDADLAVPTGTLAALEGDNGAGKTTLIRMLATVVSPDSGTITVNGHNTGSHGLDVRRSIGVSLANERSLYWRISPIRNLELFGKIAGLPKKIIASRAADLLEELELTSVAKRQVAQMSTGQRQRLMVARAFLAEPALVLLDEPFRGLDDSGVKVLKDLIERRKIMGTTLFVVAPSIREIELAADAIYVIENCRIEMR